MTIFIVSLFLPKTVHFTLPGTPPSGTRYRRSPSQSIGPPSLARPSQRLFPPTDITPPRTPTEAPLERNPFSNEDGVPVSLHSDEVKPIARVTSSLTHDARLSNVAESSTDREASTSTSTSTSTSAPESNPATRPNVKTPTVAHIPLYNDPSRSPKWGSKNQPRSRAHTPPPRSSLVEGLTASSSSSSSSSSRRDPSLEVKARELGRRGMTQPHPTHRSESHDRVFAHADWYVVNADQGNGGLRNACDAALHEGSVDDVHWVGTLGMPTDALSDTKRRQEIEQVLSAEHNVLPVFCSDKDFDGHYTHFCKQILWPVFHYQIPDNPKSKAYEDHSWKYYVNVNQAFADKLVQNWKRGDVIWVHDYHLLLVPGMVRQKIPDAKIGFFLHVAFPSSEVFRCLAVRKELLEGMLGANLVGCQIREYTRHFLQTCSRILNVEATPEGIQLDDRFVDVGDFAIGIDPLRLNKHRQDPAVLAWIQVLRERYEGMRLIVSRDKLDLVRGVRQKLLSYELFLNANPAWRDRTVLIQVALSGSENADLDATISDIVTRINSTYANLAYQPVVYLKQDIDYQQYLALLTVADALFTTSQREGMNLTSHEFLVCQDGRYYDEKRHGSLILSEFTGTSSLFGDAELAVNPWDYRQCANALKQALEMSAEEKEQRWTRLHECIRLRTGAHWFTEYLQRLDRVYEEQHRRDQTVVPRLNHDELCAQYRDARRRLFVIDCEGTLVNWGPVNEIIPISLQRTASILNELLADERNTVYVMSGREPEELQRLFHNVPQVGLIAENGSWIRWAGEGGGRWTDLVDHELLATWKASVRSIMEYFLERTPGAALEEQRCRLVFRYGKAEDGEAAERQASECASHINDACEAQRVHAVPVDGAIVVEPMDWTKSTAAERVWERLLAGSSGSSAGEASGTSQRELDGGADASADTDADASADAADADADANADATGDAVHGSADGRTPDFLFVCGDSREDEKVFRWANGLGERGLVRHVVTASAGNRCTEASHAITQGVNGVLRVLYLLAQA